MGVIGKIIVFVVNFVFWACGIALIIFGSIAVADPSIIVDMVSNINGVQYVTTILDITSTFQGVAIFMIVLGCFLFLLGGNGCHGAAKKSKISMTFYMIWLILAILVEIALIIYAAVYPQTRDTWVQENMFMGLNSTTKVGSETIDTTGKITYTLETEDNGMAYSWQQLQFQAKCCGSFDYSDYTAFSWTNGYNVLGVPYPNNVIPLSCCTTNLAEGEAPENVDQIVDVAGCLSPTPAVGTYSTEGCWKVVNKMMWQFNLISIVISCCLIVAQLLGLVFAVCLWSDKD
jgi:hypothetical protein